jgi:class 3 adenylate cyclase
LNPVLNAANVSAKISETPRALHFYTTDLARDITAKMQIVEIVVLVVLPVVWIFLLILQMRWLHHDKVAIYKCLTALPKNVVSQLSESLRVLKTGTGSESHQEEGETEVTKHKENLLKIFATAGDSHSSTGVAVLYSIVPSIAILGLAAGLVVVFCQFFPEVAHVMDINGPHLDDVLGANAYMLSLILTLNDLAAAAADGYDGLFADNVGLANTPIWRGLVEARILVAEYTKYFHWSTYGNPEFNEPPFPGYTTQIEKARSIIRCEDSTALYEDMYNICACLSLNVQTLLIEPFVYRFTRPLSAGLSGAAINTTDEYFHEIWLLALDLYDTVFAPLFEDIVSQIVDLMESAIPRAENIAIVLIILAAFFCTMIQIHATTENQNLKFVLKMLLHCDPSIVSNTPKIMDLLSGDFSTQLKDRGNRNNVFFENIFQYLPDAIIVTSSQYQIQSVNCACERIYDQADFSGDIREFFKQPQFVGDFGPLWDPRTHETIVEHRGSSLTSHLEITSAVIGQNFVFTARDRTQQVSYNQLIQQERAHSDAMLASILPANLAARVQAGEVNISFAVQSASISFLDIVEFTPWCASNSASTVMSSLNCLYREFDAICHGKPTMTKIKCIGDCYMAAGGIFSEVNQPTVHAKEMVEFGLATIKALGTVNQELNHSLRIRVGINTGGPIVAGVLGTEKPTFEILGPAINIAQQMEHEGIPMNVHISRSTYELVYGGNFIIRERGQIRIKQGPVVTYIVEGEKSDA